MRLVKTGKYIKKVFMVLVGPFAGAPMVTKDIEYWRNGMRGKIMPVSSWKTNIVEGKGQSLAVNS